MQSTWCGPASTARQEFACKPREGACAATQVNRSTVRYQSKRPDEQQLREEIKLVAKERRRSGYRRIQLTLARKGIFMNIIRQVVARNHR